MSALGCRFFVLSLLLGAVASGPASASEPPLLPLMAPSTLAPIGTLPPELVRPSELVERRRHPDALRALDGLPPEVADTRAARFLRAEALSETGRHPEAIALYEELLLRGPLLGDRLRLGLGRSLLAAGRPGDAAAVLGDVPPDSRHHATARLLGARTLVELGRADEARASLERWTPDEADLAEAFEVLGTARLASGDPDGARAAWRRSVLSSPQHRSAAAAARRLGESLTETDPATARAWAMLAGALGRRDTAVRLERLDDARALRPLAAWVDFARGTLRHTAEDHLGASALFGRAVLRAERDEPPDAELLARARFALAEATRARGRLTQALAAYAAVASDHPEHPLAPTARIAAARVAMTLRRYEEANAQLSSLLLLHPTHPERPRALFLSGWAHLMAGETARAAERLRAAANADPVVAGREDAPGSERVSGAARSLYWAGRSTELAGDPEGARRFYDAVLARHPLTYYAELTRIRLGPDAPLPAAPPLDPEEAPVLDARVTRAREAAFLGWKSEAARELLPFLLDPGAATHGRDLLAAAEVFEHIGNARAARALHREAAVHLSGDLAPAERELARRQAFPRFQADLLEHEARRQNISPWLLYGLVLRESGFVSCAESRVGAKGLTQLMGPTASDAARDLGLPPPTEALLCDPAYNLRLGAWHLKKLLRRYEGAEVLVLAAYNAGPGSVDRWRARHPELPLDVFVEEIPFEETRVYVRVVLSAARGYAWTWDRPGSHGVGARLDDPAAAESPEG